MSEKDYTSFLEIEIVRIKKRTQTTYIATAVILLFLIGYLSLILTMVKTFTQPENAAFLVADNVRANFPAFMDSTEELLAARSVSLAEGLSQRFLSTVPRLREEAQKQMDLTHTERIPLISEEFQEILTQYIRENEASIQLLAEQGSNQALAENFVNGVMQDFNEYLNEAMSEHFEGRDLGYMKEHSLFALQAMDQHLTELLESDPAELDRSQQLQKKILATIARRVIGGE